MLNNLDLNHLLTFPFTDAQARRNFLIGTLVSLSMFIVPIIPMLLISGYMARIMRQVNAGQKPQMLEWDDWGAMLQDGFYIFVVRMVYVLPFLLIIGTLMFGVFLFPTLSQNGGANSEQFMLLSIPLMFVFFLLLTPFLLAISVILPAAETHTVVHNELQAGFRIREWWPIFRANWGGFLIAFLIYMVVSTGLIFAIQFALITIVFICLLPLALPAYTMYSSLIMYTAFAQAYKEGADRLNTAAVEINHASA